MFNLHQNYVGPGSWLGEPFRGRRGNAVSLLHSHKRLEGWCYPRWHQHISRFFNQVGEMIPDQIIQSVESSRRTLIVLSKAYVDSMWTKLEFRAAHTQASDLNTRAILNLNLCQYLHLP